MVVGLRAGGILSIETGAGVALVVGGILSKEVEDGDGADAGLGWVLFVVVVVEEGQRCGTVTREEGVVFKSTVLDMSIGLKGAADTEPEVVFDVGIVIMEGITGGEEQSLVVTVQACETVTGALDSPAAELREGL